ncbi:MAG TPA: endopeptidase La [Longimicrobiales bacterium]|nr:endopeptidase La [Longimicrobiales bacterium]
MANKPKFPERVPIMPLRSTIVYPLGVIGVQIGMPGTLEMLSANPEDGLLVALVVAPGGPDDPIDPKALEKIGVLSRVSDRLNMPGGTVQATVQGVSRVQLTEAVETDGYYTARIAPVKEKEAPEEDTRDVIARILTVLEVMADEVDRVPLEVPRILRMNLADPGRFADLVATLTNFSVSSKDEILQRLDVSERLHFALEELEQQLQRIRDIKKSSNTEDSVEPDGDVSESTSAERATLLRNRIRLLQAQLGEVDPAEREIIDYLRQLETSDLPTRVASVARAEIERLRSTNPGSQDASEIRSYVDWLLNMPWRTRAGDAAPDIDLNAVEQELDRELVGLTEPKQRLLDYLAVAKMRGDLRGPIPCIVGPPDVGKKSLVCALARGLGRPVAKLELGGRGEAQIIGTRRTRAGAQPGKIAGALRSAEVKNPVFALHEMDEIGLGKVEGDPIEAMEEILEFETQSDFVDRYLDISFDIGEVMFIATAQDFYRIPRDLRDLMVEIRIAGYTPEEKVAIVRQSMLARIVAEHGLSAEDVEFTEEGLFFLAQGYARDAGLGTLQRSLAALMRARARARAQGDDSKWLFTPARIEEVLGLPRYIATAAESAPEVGVVTGLAWTAAGGELMFIEALRMPGSGRLIITGLLGDVMRESVNAAYSYVRSRSDTLGIPDDAFKDSDIHVHFPVGAIPKDGPSAGIAVTLAIASTLSNRPVRHDIAMTGEVTLRGKVLEIGGVKEKVLAAYRAGLRDVILPTGNERDLREVPDDVRENMTFHFVQRMDDVVKLALSEPTEPRLQISEENSQEPRAAKEA